ncbi:kinase-like domain-containing protein [Glomus cerebriforme]|uniref:Kinase-like domain-containing protein n=1 Tax=Glomus cerebriforme TaxID=658196 RepID=A0A397SI70_9GLOM|nr:kinase-like domain-containing protein [Glomus cerebriforme]
MESLAPFKIVEWIPYNSLQNINYLTKGGCSEIYTADWIGGQYYEWNSEQQQLDRYGTLEVILKRLENVKSANRSWFDEAKSHLTINNKWDDIVQCHGLTQDPSNGNYMLVMRKLDIDLRKYLQQNHNQITWRERIKITFDIIDALDSIHNENAIHRDLHSGNILYLEFNNYWLISDLGFCGPADKPLGSIYGNLPYIAPEVIVGKGYTFASDIYSIAMLMWEVSSGEPPFANYENDYETNYEFVMDVVNGMRPKIISGTPLKYKELMEQCWNANPEERPDINTLLGEIKEMNKLYYEQQTNNSTKLNYIQTNETSNVNIRNFNSKVYSFKDLPEPRNATKGKKHLE